MIFKLRMKMIAAESDGWDGWADKCNFIAESEEEAIKKAKNWARYHGFSENDVTACISNKEWAPENFMARF